MRFALLTLLGVLVACNGAGPSPDTAKGVTDDSIRVGMTTDLTGPLAFVGQEMSEGARLFLRHVNDQGGVHGRKIDLLVEDDAYQPQRTIAAVRKLIDRDEVFCFVANLGTAGALATESLLQREGVPLLFPATWSSVVYDPPRDFIFGSSPSYRLQSWMIAKLIVGESNEAPARLGVIFQDDDFGRDGLKGLREAVDYFGLELVAEESYQRGAIDFSSQVLNLRRAGSTHVILWTVLREAASILREAHQLNWEPEFFGSFVLGDDQIVKLTGETAANLQVLTAGDLRGKTEGMNFFRRLRDQYSEKDDSSLYQLMGFIAAQGLVEALDRAGPQPDRRKLVQALESFRGWDDNVFELPFTYGPGVRGGSEIKVYLASPDLEKQQLTVSKESIRFEIPANLQKAGY